MGKLRSIQVLRALAVLGVVIFHATKARFQVGAAGVDIFFVISGFIMAHVAKGRERGEFVTARLWRILPLYFICLALFVSATPLKPDICRAATSLTLLPVFGDCFPYIVPAWSLSYELLFYALVAVFIKRLGWLFVAIPALVIFGFAAPIGFVGNPYLFEFLAGLLIARLPYRYGLGFLGLGLALLCVAPIDNQSAWRALYWGAPAALVVYGALGLEKHFARREYDLPVWLGDASYSIYLGHTLLWASLPAPLWFLVALGGSCCIYLFVEKPLIRFGHSAFVRQPAPSPATKPRRQS